MSLKKERFIKGIILAPDTLSLDGIEGEIKVDSSTGKIQVTLKDGANPSASREIVTSSQTQTLTNKTLISPVIDTGVSGTAIETDLAVSASATKLASASAIKTYVDNVAASQNEASEISYSNATSGLTATNVQNAIDEVDGNVDNLVTLSGVALDSIDLGTFTGVTIPDNSDIKEALQAIETSHETHTGASSGVHGVAGSVVGTSDSQALTNKTIDADLNTISNIENADIKVGANIARSKLASGTANRVVVNDATGIQTDATAITAARVLISDANGIPTHSSVTSTTLGYVDATSSIQNQLDAKVDESGGTLTNGFVTTPARLDVKQNTKANLTTYALTAANGQLCFATDTKEMFQIVDGLLESVGGGAGIGGVDILFSQTFEEAALTDFTQTGLSLSTSSPLHGEISALLTHQAGTSPANDQFFKEIIPVDRKFRGQTMMLRLDSKSSASQGNVVINIKDETNSANLVASEQLQLSNDVNGKRTSVSFTIPETCASLSYTITALPESGSPTTRIDDIICELAETALLETAVEVPVVTAWQGYTPTFQGFGTPTNVEFEYRQVGESVEIRGKFTAGTTTGVEARVGLPSGLTSAGTSLIASLQIAGHAVFNVSSSSYFSTEVLIEPSVSYITFGQQTSTTAGLTKANGTICSSGNVLSFFASVPCSGLSATTTKTIPLTQSGLVQEADSMVRTSVANGFGSTATVIRRFSTLLNNVGDDVIYQDSAINGASFTIQEKGTYLISYNESNGNAGGFYFGITKNAPSLSTSITSITDANIMLARSSATGTSGLDHESVSWQGILEVGDIIRPHTSGLASTGSNATSFTIVKQGSLKQVSVNPNSKIVIPTSELRMEGASSRGSTDTAIVRFDSIAKFRGDAFTVESDAALGTRITMKKAGKLDVSTSVSLSAAGIIFISKNQSVRTSTPSVASETLAANHVSSSGYVAQAAVSGDFAVGDVIRISSNVVPSASTANSLNLSFQEQDISVSVSNVLPQYSESDLVVKAVGNSGQAITGGVTNIPFQTVSDTTGGSWNGSQFTVPEDGLYSIEGNILTTAANAGNRIRLYVNGSAYRVISKFGESSTQFHPFAIIDQFSKGQVLSIRSQDSKTLQNSTEAHYLNITKVGKPNVTGVDVTPFVNVPQPISQSSYLNSTTTFGNVNISGSLTSLSGSSSLYSYNSSTGVYTTLKRCNLSLNFSVRSAAASSPSAAIFVNNILVAQSYAQNISAYWASASWSGIVEAGIQFSFYNNSGNNTDQQKISVLATALSDQILTAPETFSTDTASLTYAGSASYTLSTLQNAPVGTFITFTYAANTNTRTQTVNTAPTQFASGSGDANANGIQIFTRAFNATSSAAQPAAIAIQIGKGLKGKSLDLYKNTGKSIAGSIDYAFSGATASYGIAQINYSEITGILYVDSGWSISSSASLALYRFSDASEQSSGYLVINASKNPVITGFGLNRIAARGVNSSGLSVANTGYTTLTYDSIKTFDTYGALNTSTGVFTAPETGYYQVQGASRYQTNSYAVNNGVGISLFKNGVEIALSIQNIQAAATIAVDVVFSDTVFLAKGDTIYLALSNGRTAGATPLNTVANQNYFSIVKTSV